MQNLEGVIYMPIHKAQELAATLMADETDGWTYEAVIIDHERGYAMVEVRDGDDELIGSL